MQNINFLGNRQTEIYMNSSLTSLFNENNLRSLSKHISLEIPLDKVNRILGIRVSEGENINKLIKIENKDSVVIGRKLSYSELKIVLSNLDNIYKEERDNYVLNYFLPAKKVKLKRRDIEYHFFKLLAEGFTENFTIVGDNYYDYYTGSDRYIITDEEARIQLEKMNQEITLKDCYDFFEETNIRTTKTFMNRFMNKWRISTQKENGENSLLSVPIKNVLQGQFNFTRDGETTITAFLMNNEWFVLNEKYLDTVNTMFSDFFNENNGELDIINISHLFQNRQLEIGVVGNENNYNKSFRKVESLENRIIVAHPILIHKVEFADLITWDDDNLYLLCIKNKFDGIGVRDLNNQIWASAQVLNNIINSHNRNIKLSEYYDKIKQKYVDEDINEVEFENKISSHDFIQLFEKKFVYIAGYVYDYKINSQSTYAKLLSLDYKKLFKQELNIDYYILGDLIQDTVI